MFFPYWLYPGFDYSLTIFDHTHTYIIHENTCHVGDEVKVVRVIESVAIATV